MKNLYLFIFFIVSLITIISCKDNLVQEKTPQLPEEVFDYNQRLDDAFVNFVSVDNEVATLGRVLFYDKNLSKNKSVSCASCHQQHLGFADNKAFSTGVNVTESRRNSLALSNIFGYSAFFWDRRTFELQDLIFQPITDHIEMGFEKPEDVVERISNTTYYPELFNNAFGNTEVSAEKIEIAMTDFLSSLVSFESKYDLYQKGEAQLSASELIGESIFFTEGRCSNCHGGRNLGGSSGAANIGLELNYADKGIGAFRDEESSNGSFKIPGLRNIALTAPYMHDGRYNTLREVLNHYNTGIIQHPNLSWILTDEFVEIENNPWWNPSNGGTPTRFNFSELELDALEAFLHTLTDYEYINEEMYSDPFH